jgi:hypothetical protein
MLTDLEKFLRKIRSKLDVEQPDDQAIWEGIRSGMQHASKSERMGIRLRPILRLRRIAAILIVVFCLGYIAYDLIHPSLSSAPMVKLADIDVALADREKSYQVQVRLKQEEVQASGKADNHIISELIEEIEQLDAIYDQTMADLTELGYDEQIIHTLFDTYEKKIQLLELIILETNKIQSYENEKINRL